MGSFLGDVFVISCLFIVIILTILYILRHHQDQSIDDSCDGYRQDLDNYKDR